MVLSQSGTLQLLCCSSVGMGQDYKGPACAGTGACWYYWWWCGPMVVVWPHGGGVAPWQGWMSQSRVTIVPLGLVQGYYRDARDTIVTQTDLQVTSGYHRSRVVL